MSALMAACSTAHYPLNPPLAAIDGSSGYRGERFFAADPNDHLFVHVSFSGGGARAAALGFGVLETLKDAAITWEGKPRRLVDEIDVVMGVSGGSMMATAFALHGADGLGEFKTRFFDADLQDDLVADMLLPWNAWRLTSATYGRSDLFAEFLDRRIYQGATFGMLSQRLRKPFAIIYAADMANGARFEFNQDQFDFLCSDLDGVSLGRAVAASSAAPLVLSPVVFLNHAPANNAAGCGEPLLLARSGEASFRGRSKRAAQMATLREPSPEGGTRRYVHLLDGGLSDNVNTTGPLEYFEQFGGFVRAARHVGYRGVRRAVFIVVNAETSRRSSVDATPEIPGLMSTAFALADIPINRNSETSLQKMRASIQQWEAEVNAAHAQGDFDVFAEDAKFYLVEVDLRVHPEGSGLVDLESVPTSLQLPPKDIDALRRFARDTLNRSDEFQRLIGDLH